jgi:hypothetical protein
VIELGLIEVQYGLIYLAAMFAPFVLLQYTSARKYTIAVSLALITAAFGVANLWIYIEKQRLLRSHIYEIEATWIVSIVYFFYISVASAIWGAIIKLVVLYLEIKGTSLFKRRLVAASGLLFFIACIYLRLFRIP